MNSNNKKALLFLIPAVLILVMVIVAKIINKTGGTTDNKTASFIDPNLHRMEDTINSKQRVYAHGQQIEEQKRNEKKVNFDDLGEMAKNNGNKLGYKQDSSKNGSYSSNNYSSSVYSSKSLQINENKTTDRLYTRHKVNPGSPVNGCQQTTAASSPAVVPAVQANTSDSRTYSDICVYGSKKTVNNTSKSLKNDFFPAYLEEDTKITDKAAVVFILDKDCIINGNQIFKNALLFGTVVNASSRFDIYIHNVKNTDGTTFGFNNVVVFNEKYGRGIVPEGTVPKALQQSADQSANNATGDMGYSTSTGVNLAQQGLTNTVNAITSSRNPSISLAQGYKVFIKVIQ
jgi:hypothetical protein